MTFSEQIRANFALPYASGTADRNGVAVDCSGYAGVCFVVTFGAIAAGAASTIKLQHGDQSDLSDAVDVAGTAQAVTNADDSNVRMIDVKHPIKRYVRLVLDNDGSNAVAASAVAYLYNGREVPVDHDTDVVAEAFLAPASGTA